MNKAIFLNRSRIGALFIALVLLTLFKVTAREADAAQAGDLVEVFELQQQDRDQDGQPDLTVIKGSFATAEDEILVYDRDGDMVWSENWEEAVDFDDDMWVFDVLSDGVPELVISFSEGPEGLVAELWDDQLGENGVLYQASDEVRVGESEWPTVRVVAPDGWWVKDDRINFNLEIEVDGPLRAAGASQSYQRYLKVDGVADFLVKVYDSDNDGRPDVHWVDAWPKAPRAWGIRRSSLMVNPSDDEVPIREYLFWPYLGTTVVTDEYLEEAREDRFDLELITKVPQLQGFVKYYNLSQPPIQMAWHKGALAFVGEFVASRFNDDTWFIYSSQRLKPDEAVSPSFEAPFAFYDLAGDNDGRPEQAIRVVQVLPGETFLRRELDILEWNSLQHQEIRYSWDQDNDDYWDYKFGLVGRHDLTQFNFQVEDLSINTVPPDQLRQWVADSDWDGATFVVAEDAFPRSSEGLKVWKIDESWRLGYVSGLLDEPPREVYEEIEEGYRGEYSFDLLDQVTLYLSPVDDKLHMTGADKGLWNLGNEQIIEYANLDADPYIDRWTYFEDGDFVHSLYVGDDYLLLVRPDSVEIVETERQIMPIASDIQPPIDTEAWSNLGTLLAQSQPSYDAFDFKAMFEQFIGERTVIENVTVDSIRMADEGLRFALNVNPETTLQSETVRPAFETPLKTGRYLVTLDQTLDLQPMTPPVIEFTRKELAFEGVEPAPLTPLEVRAVVINKGLDDIETLQVTVAAESGGEQQEIAEFQTSVMSGDEQSLSASWTPPEAGDWTITLSAEEMNLSEFDAREPVHLEESINLTLAPSSQLSWSEMTVKTNGGQLSLIVLPLMLVVLSLIAGVVVINFSPWNEA